MSLSWLGDKETATAKPSPYGEGDADEMIGVHAIHWLICIETYREVRTPKIGMTSIWELGYTHEETCLYKQTCSNNVIIGFRGTKTAKDLYDDAKITMDQVFPRAKEAVDLVKSVLKDHPEYTIELCGHSLGGAIAREAGKELNLGVVTFNAAAPPTAPVESGSNEIDYHIVFDIISAWQSPNTIRIDKGYEPIPNWWQKMNFYLRMWASINDIIKAHELANFSKDRSGNVVSAEKETQLMNKWLSSLPSDFKPYVYFFLFGVGGEIGLPDLK